MKKIVNLCIAAISVAAVHANAQQADVTIYGSMTHNDAWTGWDTFEGIYSFHPVEGASEGAKLSWRARSSDKKYFDGYTVYLSTDGTDRGSFATTLYSTPEEGNTWIDHVVDLSAFVGRDVNIAFVNNSTNKARLYIDDIKVGVDIPLVVSLDTPAIVEDSDYGCDVTVSGTLSTELDDPSVLGDITLAFADEEVTIPNEQLTAGPCTFCFAATPHIPAGGKLDIEIACTAQSGYSTLVSRRVWSASRSIVVEEFTGTWCAWCVRGIVYMEAIKQKYGESVIPLCVHQGDAMTVDAYVDGIDYLKEEAIPNSIINRRYECDPAMLPTLLEQGDYEEIPAAVTSMTIDYEPETNSITADVGVAFCADVNDGSYALAYILVEDNVHRPDDGRYYQKNAYSGGVAGAMGGFEDLPAVIAPADMTFRDVVRAMSDGGPHGVPRSLPGVVEAGKQYNHTYQMEIPEDVCNNDELALVVMVLDGHSGEVLNGCRVQLADVIDFGNVCDPCHNISGEIYVYTIDGMCLGKYPSKQAFDLTCPRKGMYIIRCADATFKFIY